MLKSLLTDFLKKIGYTNVPFVPISVDKFANIAESRFDSFREKF